MDNLSALKAIVRSLEVNYHKSNIIRVNIDRPFLMAAKSFLHCNVVALPFKFLGVPIGANPRLYNTWRPVIERFKKRLSIGGRLVSINSTMGSLPLYFSFYKAPKKVISLLTKFLWQG